MSREYAAANARQLLRGAATSPGTHATLEKPRQHLTTILKLLLVMTTWQHLDFQQIGDEFQTQESSAMHVLNVMKIHGRAASADLAKCAQDPRCYSSNSTPLRSPSMAKQLSHLPVHQGAACHQTRHTRALSGNFGKGSRYRWVRAMMDPELRSAADVFLAIHLL